MISGREGAVQPSWPVFGRVPSTLTSPRGGVIVICKDRVGFQGEGESVPRIVRKRKFLSLASRSGPRPSTATSPRRILADKLERQILGRKSEEEQRLANIRRQKRKRSQRAKEKILEAKHRSSEVKEGRSFRSSGEG